MARPSMTKRELSRSIKELGATMPMDKITVMDISEHCGINRQSFYYHFKDKFELIEWIFATELFEPLQRNLSLYNWHDKVSELLDYMNGNKEFFINTIKSNKIFFYDYMNKAFSSMFESSIAELGDDGEFNLSDEERRIYSSFLAYGVTGLLVDWITGGMMNKEGILNMLERVIYKTEQTGHRLYLMRKRQEV